jgi:hypothetical protein
MLVAVVDACNRFEDAFPGVPYDLVVDTMGGDYELRRCASKRLLQCCCSMLHNHRRACQQILACAQGCRAGQHACLSHRQCLPSTQIEGCN